jgi:hypothetical protein
MVPRIAGHAASLVEVQSLFSEWCKIRKKVGPVPTELWEAVVGLKEQISIGLLAKALGLNSTKLKLKLKEFGSSCASAPAAMVRATNSPWKVLENGADLRPALQVSKIVAVEPLQKKRALMC